MACDYCQSEPHLVLCPMTSIEAIPERKLALEMGVPVCTSDWIASWALAGRIQIDGPELESLIELFSLHHNYVVRLTERKYAGPREYTAEQLLAGMRGGSNG